MNFVLLNFITNVLLGYMFRIWHAMVVDNVKGHDLRIWITLLLMEKKNNRIALWYVTGCMYELFQSEFEFLPYEKKKDIEMALSSLFISYHLKIFPGMILLNHQYGLGIIELAYGLLLTQFRIMIKTHHPTKKPGYGPAVVWILVTFIDIISN